MSEEIREHVLKSRYLLAGERDFTDICRRVADHIGKTDTERLAFYKMMVHLDFLPNSPTLMNAGTSCSQLAACFVIPVGSTIGEIFEAVRQGAIIQVTGGGTGYNFSDIPPEGVQFGPADGISPGPTRFIEIFDCATSIIRQGGRRRGANMGILDIYHPDILTFIHAKHKEGTLTNFNLSVMIPDSFMEAVSTGGADPVLFTHPHTLKAVRVRDVLDAIVDGIYHNGEPGVLFSNAINQGNRTPHLGRIQATNPCGEEPLLPYESCILGSINLAHCVKNNHLNLSHLEEIVRLSVRFLDAAIDATQHPLKEVQEATLKTRKIGLGVMGLHDALLLAGIPYDSDEARSFAREAMSFITQIGVDESLKMGRENGSFPAWEGSTWDTPIRNAQVTTIAPTGTISLLAGCSPGIEPVYSFVYTRHHTAGGRFEMVHPIFSRALDLEIARLGYSGSRRDQKREEVIHCIRRTGSLQKLEWLSPEFRRLFVSALDISWQDHLLMQEAFQRSVHASIAKTINLPASADRDEIREAILMAWRLSLKGVTFYRTGSRRDIVYGFEGCSGCGYR